MPSFLLFTLYGPLSSWGEVAVGSIRPSADRPTRSALLGLIGACLGIERHDQDRQEALIRSLGVAVRTDAGGSLLEDFHTFQSVSGVLGENEFPNTRRASLLANEKRVKTSITNRQYRQDACYTGVVWLRGDGVWSLDQIADAMVRPAYVPFLGRKACSLGWPLSPRIVEADGLVSALERYEPPQDLADRGALSRRRRVDFERDAPGIVPNFVESSIRRDNPRDRNRWAFSPRPELTFYVEVK